MKIMSVKDSWGNLTSELRRVGKRGSEKPKNYLTIRSLLDQIQYLTLYDDVSFMKKTNLVHYTTWDSALRMLNNINIADQAEVHEVAKPNFRMYNYEHSNDPDEGRIKPPELKEIENKIIDLVESSKSGTDNDSWIEKMKTGTGTYGCSFSSGSSGIEDDLTYWRLYGNDGKGCSLKISSALEKRIYKVRYRDKDFTQRSNQERKEDTQVAQRLNELLSLCEETINEAPNEAKDTLIDFAVEVLLNIVQSYYHLIKHVTYEGEKEWRMISVMSKLSEVRFDINSKNIIKRYVTGASLDEMLSSSSIITVGPTVPNPDAARAYIEHLAKETHKIKYVTVKNSKQTYRQVF